MNRGETVYVMRETLDQSSGITTFVNRYHHAIEISVEDACEHNFPDPMMIIVDIKLSSYDVVKRVRAAMDNPSLSEIPSLFILSSLSRLEVVQSTAMGATEFLTHPFDDTALKNAIARIANNRIEQSWAHLSKTQEAALKVSLKVFEDTFKNVRDGIPFSQEDVREGCDLIIKATAQEGLGSLMDAVKEHHNQTYRHSMMVCGYLIAFGLLLGVRGSDLQRLSVCGLVHDIGKAFIPLTLLDKTDPLNDDDWIVIRSHPAYTRQALEDSDCDIDILHGAIHHHEKLDGTGYPDGQKGDEISDFARMVAIADIYSSLVEKRAYKPAMGPQQAYDLMLTMEGHLDMDLLKAFKPIALETQI